ncbi:MULTISPECIES: hypothetical protein [Trichocoleus]|uniref:Transmembrane protein n=1 Tax=Trichocoleus desertorum GB2-A4 TaxID=2933944 RepID=A0ABV0J7L6_9CYAN|nr:hypothetical protein [Trichocoleus sp. FACHB-46]
MFTPLIVLAILMVVIALVTWALRLMQEAIEHQEFSLMLAGCLVATAAAAIMGVYLMMGDYMGYVSQLAQRPYVTYTFSELPIWEIQAEEVAQISLPLHRETLQKRAPQTFATVNP